MKENSVGVVVEQFIIWTTSHNNQVQIYSFINKCGDHNCFVFLTSATYLIHIFSCCNNHKTKNSLSLDDYTFVLLLPCSQQITWVKCTTLLIEFVIMQASSRQQYLMFPLAFLIIKWPYKSPGFSIYLAHCSFLLTFESIILQSN